MVTQFYTKNIWQSLFLLILFILCFGGVCSNVTALEGDTLSHPRLYFNDDQIGKIKNRASNPFVDSLIVKPMLREAKKEEIQLNFPEKSMLNSCMAYVITGKKCYLKIAVSKLEKVVNAPGDWTIPPYKYKDLKYMNIAGARKAYAIAIAYDILHNELPDDLKKKSLDVLREKVFSSYLKAFAKFDSTANYYVDDEGHNEWWTRCYFPWNTKVNGMIGLAALATLDEIPESKRVLELARFSLKKSHREFERIDHDGAFKDGPVYFIYYLIHAIRFYAALENCQNTDDGFFELPGIKNSLDFISNFTAPDSTFVPYGFTPHNKFRDRYDELYYLLKKKCDPKKLNYLDSYLLYGGNLPFALLWRPCKSKDVPIPEKVKLKHYHTTDWAFANDQRFFVTVRGGDNAVRKNHPEAGEIKVWLNETFFLSPGDYLNPTSEKKNTLFFNQKGQINPAQKLFFSGDSSVYYANIMSCETIQDNEYIKVDLTKCYEGIELYQRHVLVTNSGSLIVLDDAVADNAVNISQNWCTWEEIDGIKEDGSICLHSEKRGLDIRIFTTAPVTKAIEKDEDYSCFKISTTSNTKQITVINVFSPGALRNPEVFAELNDNVVTVRIKTKKGLDEYRFVRTTSGLIFKNQN